MWSLINIIDVILFIYFTVIAFAVPLFDAQTIFPSYIYPDFLVHFKNWFINEFGHYLLSEKPHFFVGIAWLELLFAWPISIVSLYGIVAGKSWFQTTCLMYGIYFFTAVVAILSELVGSGRASQKLLIFYYIFLSFAVLAVLRALVGQFSLLSHLDIYEQVSIQEQQLLHVLIKIKSGGGMVVGVVAVAREEEEERWHFKINIIDFSNLDVKHGVPKSIANKLSLSVMKKDADDYIFWQSTEIRYHQEFERSLDYNSLSVNNIEELLDKMHDKGMVLLIEDPESKTTYVVCARMVKSRQKVLKLNVQELLDEHDGSIPLSSFEVSYKDKFKAKLDYHFFGLKDFDSLCQFLNLVVEGEKVIKAGKIYNSRKRKK
ncbi:transmembrane protein 6/97 [Tanacetum coccineum]